LCEDSLAPTSDSTPHHPAGPGRVDVGGAPPDASDRPGNLEQLRTSVITPDSFEIREWWLDFAALYHREVAELRDALDARARAGSPWAEHRARSLSLEPVDRLAICGKRTRVVRCGCRRLVLQHECGALWCESCVRRRAKRLRRKLLRAIQMHSDARRTDGARDKLRWYLVTLTPPGHSGDLAHDRELLLVAWKRWRQWMWARVGAFPFALTVEVTDGADGRGHVHAHAVCLLPFFDWSQAQQEWKRATGDARAHLHFAIASHGKAAGYLGKYATKGVSPTTLRPDIAAKFIRATYGKRRVTVSEQFWRPMLAECPKCHEAWRQVQRPISLGKCAPFAVWRSRARRDGVVWTTGPPQKAFAEWTTPRTDSGLPCSA